MIIPLGFGQANFIFTGAGYPTGAQVTLGFEHTGSDLNAAECAEFLENTYVPDILPKQVNDITLDSIRVKYGPNDVGQEATRPVGSAGLDAGDDHSPNVALLIKKVTESGGRANRGRMYLPGLNESMVDTGGVIDGSELSAWQDAFDTFFDDLVSGGLTPMVLHGESSPASAPTEVVSFAVDSKAATQRRRLRR